MKKIMAGTICFCTTLLAASQSFSGFIEKGSAHRDSGQFSQAQKERVWDLEDVAHDQGVDSIRSVVAYASPNDGTYDYVLERKNYLAGISISDQSVAGPWPLSRWKHDHYFPEELENRYVDHNYTSSFGEDRPFHLELGERSMSNMGCLADTPLRYGDINSDSNSELVIWKGNDLVVFSPAEEKVIFSQRMRVEDWLSTEDTEAFLTRRFGNLEPHFPQYQSSVLRSTTANFQAAALGYRGYGKLYLDDFNEDGHHDIVVWHKFYISNTRGDSTPGFTHERDTLLHYSLVDGEYQPQETEEDVIRGWLAENELTWQDGYPSKSECEGEEGELIPEMHDPLLNDPDVLK